jgi:hypothetical protein
MSIGRILAKRFYGPEVETRIRIETSATGGLDPSSVRIRIDALRFSAVSTPIRELALHYPERKERPHFES